MRDTHEEHCLGRIPAATGISITGQAILRLSHIVASTPYQRELLGAYSRAVIELARCSHELQLHGQIALAGKLAAYASQVTDLACGHIGMSAEIAPKRESERSRLEVALENGRVMQQGHGTLVGYGRGSKPEGDPK